MPKAGSFLHRSRHDSVWHFRRRVPDDVRAALGLGEIIRSLRTADRTEAVVRARALAVATDQLFARLRGGGMRPEGGSVSRGKGKTIDAGLVVFFDGLGQPRMQTEPGDTPDAIEAAVRGLAALPSRQPAGTVMSPAHSPIAPAEGLPEAGNGIAEVPTLAAVLESWAKASGAKEKSVDDYRFSVREFGRLAGIDPERISVTAVTKAHFIKLRDGMLVEAKIDRQTMIKRLSLVGTILNHAMHDGYISANPATGVTLASKTTGKSRLPFSAEQLRAIFSSRIYLSGFRPAAGCGEAAYWLPVLGYATGARLEELGQLRVSDVRLDGGIWFLDVGAEGETKTASSVRKVPLHPRIVELGFDRYMKSLDGSGRLFPRLREDKYAKLTAHWSKWFGRWRKEVGITDSRAVFHSFRHGFKDLCRDAGIAKDVHDRLTGHAPEDVGGTYGLGHSLETLAAAVGKLRLEALDELPVWNGVARGRSVATSTRA